MTSNELIRLAKQLDDIPNVIKYQMDTKLLHDIEIIRQHLLNEAARLKTNIKKI